MSCGCSKKKGFAGSITIGERTSVSPEEWGPPLWKFLHCSAWRIGRSGNPLMDADDGRHIELLVTHLPEILPCKECQAHAREYIAANRPTGWSSLRGAALYGTVSAWLSTFHNSVRVRQGKEPITGESYDGCTMAECEYKIIVDSVVYAASVGWVKKDAWKRWQRTFNQFRLQIGI